MEIQEVLTSLSKEELIEIISQLTVHDRDLESRLLLAYGKENNHKKILEYKKLIKSIVRRYSGRTNFIPYHQTFRFSNELLKLLNDIKFMQNVQITTEVALLLLHEGVDAFQYADDSDGSIGMLVDGVLEYLNEFVIALKVEDFSSREYVFRRLMSVSESDLFEGWDDFRIATFQLCMEFADIEIFRKEIWDAIEKQISLHNEGNLSRYIDEMFHKLLFNLVLEYGSADEAAQYVQKYIHFPFFREYAIHKSIMNKDYSYVIRLAELGEQLDNDRAGLLKKWKMARYEGYKGLAMLEEQSKLAKELLMDGEYMYYAELESLGYEEKEKLYSNIIAELRQSKSWRAKEIYLRLISDKNDICEMMQYVKNNIFSIEKYAERLWDEYPNEIEKIYTAHIYNTANVASNRKQYKEVCGMLKRFKKIVGKDSQKSLIIQLENKFKKRPAFLDELAKLK